jgi:hypothetical protein
MYMCVCVCVCVWNQKSKMANNTGNFLETTHLIEPTMYMNNKVNDTGLGWYLFIFCLKYYIHVDFTFYIPKRLFESKYICTFIYLAIFILAMIS